MPTIHFYDTLTAGRSPAEGQVVRYDSAFYSSQGPAELEVSRVRLRDDLYLDLNAVLYSELALMALNEGTSEVDWARRAFDDFTRPHTLHVGFGSSTRHDPFIRASLYRNLLPHPCMGLPVGAHYLDLDILLRAIHLIRPEELPWDIDRLSGGVGGLYQFLMWDAGLGQENRALRVKEVLSTISVSSAKLVNHAISHSSPKLIKALMGLDAGEVWDLRSANPVVLVHPMLPSNRGAILAMPVAADVNYPDLICMVDLECDLTCLCSDSTASLQGLARTGKGDRDAPLFHLSMSRVPFVAPLNAIRPEDARRLGINIAGVKTNIATLRTSNRLVGRLRDEPVLQLHSQPADADHRMWAGDFPPGDLDLMRQLHSKPFADWPEMLGRGTDRRLRELGTRMLGRYSPEAVPAADRESWRRHLEHRVCGDSSGSIRLERLLEHVEDVRMQYPTSEGLTGLRDRLLRLKES